MRLRVKKAQMKDFLQIHRDDIEASINQSNELNHDKVDEDNCSTKVKKPSYVQSHPEFNSHENDGVSTIFVPTFDEHLSREPGPSQPQPDV